MAITKVHTYTNIGLEWYQVTIEVDSNNALPTIEIIWLPDAAIKESKERIRWAFRNCWVTLPPKKIVLNLAPSHIKKVWTRFDLSLAVWILQHMYSDTLHSDVKECFEKSLFFWELGLDGAIKHVNWVLPSVISAYKKWWTSFFVPQDTFEELSCIPWITVYSLSNFWEVISTVQNWKLPHGIQWTKKKRQEIQILPENNLWYIKWHAFVKQALRVAAAWMHNILMIWPPWSGKTMLSKAVNSLLPPLSFTESIDVSRVYSIIWWLPSWQPLIVKRPFRSVHHTASKVSIVWWGRMMTPWEISLSHRWILFFDELPEFPREVLEVLRQPLEDKTITISRASGSVCYPADFMFIAAMNPCKCWFYWDKNKPCSCSLNDIKRYQSKISWPLIDRFDMIVEVHRESIDTILEGSWTSQKNDSSILNAWNTQKQRYAKSSIILNSQLWPKEIDQFISLDKETYAFLKQAIDSLSLSPRVMHRLMKVARTIADLQWASSITSSHIAEAVQYRSRKMFVL
jgi:magnesium chelatase family protein